MTPDDPLEVAEKLFRAIEQGDVDRVRAIYAPECTVWHNFDEVEQSAEQNLELLGGIVKRIRGLRYEEIRRRRTAEGFLQQHVLRGTAPNGSELEVPACMLVTVRDGKITRIEEYLDSAQLAPILASR